MNFSAYTVAFSPLVPWWVVVAFASAALLLLMFGAWRRARGAAWRGATIAVLLLILVNPALVEEKRTPQRDVAVVVLDQSPSQQIGDRTAASAAALQALTDQLAKEPDLDVRVVRAGAPQPGGD